MKAYFLVTIFYSIAYCYGQGSGKALLFDAGGNDYVAANSVAAAISGRDFTTSVWFRTTSSSGSQTLFGINTASQENHLQIAPNFIYFCCSGGSGSTFAYPVDFRDGNWHQLTFVHQFASKTNRVYVDGVLVLAPVYSSMAFSPTALVSIGQEWDPGETSEHFAGHIDEVRIWNRALSQDEIRHHMCEKLTGTEPGLVAYYRMDEGADNTCTATADVCDASGNGNHGTKF
jgi:hypothetical protein